MRLNALVAENRIAGMPFRTAYQAALKAVAALALALALCIHANPLPEHCTIIGTVNSDEGFPLAACTDGTYLYQDLDGAKHHAPGSWRDASGYMKS